MNKKQKIYSCLAIVILLIGGLCCSAFAVNVLSDPERRNYFHYPSEPVISIYEYNAPGFARGIYLTSQAEDDGDQYYANKLYNCMGLFVDKYNADPNNYVDHWSDEMAQTRSKSVVRYDDVNIRSRRKSYNRPQ